ncbi:MAG: class I SAM-dependent methyltransferase [Methylobacteriaceae bacterium]|nr:class I SAM-dependent methyltransferase [Methylobacteriaceae bacterium]
MNSDFNSLIGTEGFGYRIDERAVELPWVVSCLPDGPCRLLDAGSSLNHAPVLEHPKLRGKRLFISTLNNEGYARTDLNISYVYEDFRETCFRENYFDIIACISTLEHVGLDNTFLYTPDKTKDEDSPGDYLLAVRVLRSVLKPGGSMYISVPFGKPVNHGWFQVFDAARVDTVIEEFKPSRYRESIFMYEEDRWRVSSREEAAEATCFDINVQKEYEADFLAFSRSIVCLELVR